MWFFAAAAVMASVGLLTGGTGWILLSFVWTACGVVAVITEAADEDEDEDE